MTQHFDPYHRWLGIPAKHQPADYYRLLALERFEDDPEVIGDAAERQIAHVRRYQLGPHSDLSQQILNELAAAKVCLLTPAKKAEYDRRLREQVAAQEQAARPVAPPSPQPLPPIIVTSQSDSEPAQRGATAGTATAPSAARVPRPQLIKPPKRTWKSGSHLSPVSLIGLAAGGGVALGLVMVLLWSSFSGGDSRGVGDPVAAIRPATPAAAEAKPKSKAERDVPNAEPDAPDAKPNAAATLITAKPADAPAAPVAEFAKKAVASELTTLTVRPEAANTEAPGKEAVAKEPATNQPPERKADKERPAPPPGKKPFADLKATATLPDVSAAEPLVLGPVYVPSGEMCFVKLRGGEKARRGSQHLVMKNANGGLAEKEWEISVCDADGAETVVALLVLNRQSQLVFWWEPKAKTQELSPYLCNGAFSLSCAGEWKTMTFREPETVAPLVVDFNKPSSKEDWPIKMCPDPEAVRFAITGVEGAKCTVEPAGPMPARKTTASVKIEDGGGMLSLKIDASLTNNFQMAASPYIKPSPAASRPDKFVRRMFENNLKAAQSQSEQLKQRVEFAQKYANSNAPDASKVEQHLAAFELEAWNAETLVQDMRMIDDMLKALGEGIKIQFRVYYDADSTEVVLLKSGS